MKKNIRTKVICLLILVLGIFGITLNIFANDDDGKITLSKVATKVDDKNFGADNPEKGRYANVTLTINANSYPGSEEKMGKVDIILVLDSSGSMNRDADGNSGVSSSKKRITALKNTATTFVENIIGEKADDGESLVKIGIVEYDSTVVQSRALTDNETALKRYISNLSAGGATNIHAGILEADKLLDAGRDDASKIVLILTDGIPTKYNYTYSHNGKTGTVTCGNGSTDTAGGSYEVGNRDYNCPTTLPSDAAKEGLDQLKENHPTTDVWTITFGNESAAATKLAYINPVSADDELPVYKNLKSLTAEDLEEEFKKLEEYAVDVIGTKSIVTDIIPKEFTLTEESEKALIAQGATFEVIDGATHITWNVGNIKAGEEKKLTYNVIAKDEYYGSIYTNVTDKNYQSAVLTTTVDKENPYYANEQNKTLNLKFEAPVADIPAISEDNHYKDDSTYVGVAESVITGTTVLANDLTNNSNVILDKENASQQLTITDEVVIDTNTNTVSLNNGSYQIKNGDKVLGTLTMNDDGTFTFVSEENVEGDVTFDYHIKTTVVRDGKTSYLYSNSSTVTLKIIPRERISLSGTKVWADNNNQDGIRPDSIEVVLRANGKVHSELVVKDNWTYKFENLYKYEAGHEGDNSYLISYIVEEKTNVAGYTSSVSGTTITNTHTPETIDIAGNKVWADDSNRDGIRPESITVKLLADGEVVRTATVTEDTNWEYVFENVPKYNAGEEIEYTVSEDEVEGYTTSISGTTITNTHVSERVSINGSKTWADNDNQDGIRPERITVRLLANGKEVASKVVTEDDGWLYSFTNLYKYENGEVIEYTVTEDEVEGYTTTVSGTTITNTHTPETINVNGRKVWVDDLNRDGKRPGSITINLLANGSLVDSKVVTSETNWEYVFENVPKYKDGRIITYTVSENTVEGYTTSISGTTITNTHVSERVSISGSKTWVDNNNQDGIRPREIVVKLLANGVEINAVTITEEDNWEYSFNNLFKYENGEEIEYTISEVAVAGYETDIDGYDITNTHTPEKINISGVKTWDDNDDQDGKRPDEIVIRLLANGEEKAVKTVNEDSDWEYEFTGLDKYKNGVEIEYTVTEDTVEGYTASVNGMNVTNTHTPETLDIAGSKTWDDNEDQDGMRPESITVKLLADGEVVRTITVTKDTNWEYEFKDVPKYADGEEIEYTISEVAVTDYETVIDGYDITNSHTPETIDIAGSKTWDDNDDQDGKRPESITVKLLANGEVVRSATVTADSNWEYEFTDLDKYANGKEIEYTVSEDAVSGYETEIDGYDITNTHTPELITVTGSKTWVDNNNQDGMRPESIIVNLLADGEVVRTITVTDDTNWEYEFKDVPKYADGDEIVYTVSEEAVEDYTTTIDGMNITNTHSPETIDISGAKTWDDNDDQDGIRPENITVKLLANGLVVRTATVTEESDWEYEFTDLARYANGMEISYTVVEDAVDGYTTTINGYNITNTHEPELITVNGSKTWVDSNNQDGIRPESITVKLLADGEVVRTITVTKDTNWEYEFKDVDKYSDGKEIVYTVSEEAVEGYTTTIDGMNITNTHTPGTIDVTGTKTWEDKNDQDGIRPESIKVRLLADGEEVSSKVVTENDGWAYTFANLPEFKSGQRIVYTISEDAVSGYETEIDGYDITNTHKPEKISVSGSKTWDDNDDQDGKRPSSIKVRLLANGEEVASKVVTADSDWKYTFTDVDKYSNGKEITYTVTEDAVEGYTGTVDGMDIVNKHEPVTITITGEKVWVDANDIEGLRPESITVRLYANGEEVASTEVTEADEWKYSFENVPQYSNGKEINYTVGEDSVEHYEMSIDKDNKFIIVNTHDPKDITVSGTKTWVDADNRYGRPESIEVTLTGKIGDKVIVEETREVTEADEWKYTFNNLPEYREGILVVYTIDEADIRDYTKSINGFDITNTYTPETIDIVGSKKWDDNDNQDGVRPESITINLLANGEKVATTEVTEATNWAFEFKNQVVYANGNEITYTVEEVSVDGYTTAIEGFDVTNHHTPETVSYTVSKVWNDQDNNDRIRPEEITVRLYADGTEIAVQVINEASNWTYSFTDLAKYRDGGIAINYEIIEDEVKGYTTTIEKSVSENDTNITNVVITNTHENEKNEITINKTWLDGNNESGKRPNSITVTITGKVNGEVVITEEVEITEDMEWTYITNNYDKYLNGEEIIYEIEEKAVEGYETYYEGYDITNIYIQEEVLEPPHTGVVEVEFVSYNTVAIIDRKKELI